MKSSIAIAALVASALAVAAAAPVSAQTSSSSSVAPSTSSSAEPSTSTPAPGASTAPTAPGDTNAAPALPKPDHRMQGMRKGAMGGGGRMGMFDLICSDRGPAVVERVLDRMEKHLQLNADQENLFAAFKAKALTNETTYADACQASRPAAKTGERPDILARLKAEVALDTARLAALNDILPSFEAFYNSLTDQQKADLAPRHGMRMDRQDNRGPRFDRQPRPEAPGR